MASSEPIPAADSAAVQFSPESILRDYRIAFQSREASLLGRKEVLTGKAKFGIFGDGKEVAQVALARAFRKGDFRAGYYRDQTLMMALGCLRLEEFFAQLYADPDPAHEPSSAGRQMNAHFATQLLGEDGSWREHTASFNSSADLSPTGSQMPRLVGLALASHLYRELPGLRERRARFSDGGNEIAWGTIGDASCAEGLFWESVNAAGVLRVPLLLSIWDDGYGISVPTDVQITKGDLSDVLRGFQRAPGGTDGYDLYTVRGWDYAALCETYLTAAEIVRREHVPAIVHVTELTQPQGHSTSGSHERYKSPERLAWEQDHDCLRRMRAWMVDKEIAESDELDRCEDEDRQLVREMQRSAWQRYREPIEAERRVFAEIAGNLAAAAAPVEEVESAIRKLERLPSPMRRDLLATAQDLLVAVPEDSAARAGLVAWMRRQEQEGRARYGSHLYAEGAGSALSVPEVKPVFAEDTPLVNGFEVLNRCFDAALSRYPHLVAFGEDVGRLGDVNQGFAGLQERYGEVRVADTGIREATIVGQAIGLALRGIRPLAEIQYLDYLHYALQILADDLATLRWRTRGRQKAPVIVRTRGHRLEGVWHAGSPMGALIHLLRGIHLCVPRNMTQAAGMYNTLLQADDPAVVVEVLNGYRVKERPPENIGEFTVPLGVPEVLRQGTDVTVVTYGACCRIVRDAAELLARVGIDVEIVDLRTLLPLDRVGRVVESLSKTNRILVVDEDVPGGASAFVLQQVLEAQGGYHWLDSPPATVSAPAHRPAYGSDGDYFSKPNREDVFRAVRRIMREADPGRFT